MNYYERHIGDYLKDTAHLSILEHGVYSRLLDVYYTRESGIPDSEAARLIGARSRAEKDALRAVLSEFFVQISADWTQDRCDREIARYKDKQEKAKRSADARWNGHRGGSDGNASAFPSGDTPPMRPHSGGNAPQSPIPSNHLSEANASGGQPPPAPPPQKLDPAGPAAALAPVSTPAQTPAPLTAQDQVFAIGVAYLTSCDITEKNARSFLAMQCKAHTAERVVEVLQRAAEANPVQPVPWLVEALKQGPAQGARPADRKSRQLATAALMTGAAPSVSQPQQETIDVESRLIPEA